MTSRYNGFQFRPAFRRKLKLAIEDVCKAEDPTNAAEMSEAFIKLIEHGLEAINRSRAGSRPQAPKTNS
jgi:hypothetical protein